LTFFTCSVGHAQTFLIALSRARLHGGTLLLRIEDLDTQRCKPHYLIDMMEDFRWFGIKWDNDIDVSAASNVVSYGNNDSGVSSQIVPNNDSAKSNEKDLIIQENHKAFHFWYQSLRQNIYILKWEELLRKGYIYPSSHSRRDVLKASSAPHEGETELLFPVTLRPLYFQDGNFTYANGNGHIPNDVLTLSSPNSVNWRFRVPDGLTVSFIDERCGPQSFIAGKLYWDIFFLL
jgi:glutamyl-tRNA synthetase